MTKIYDKDVTAKPLGDIPLANLITDNDNPVVTSSLDSNTIHHNNYLEYLQFAWANHIGVTVDPTFLWYMTLSEVALTIRSNPEKYRSLFTTTDDSREILVQTLNPTVLPIDSIVQQLDQLVPIDTDAFFPDFSTKTDQYQLASQIMFCDAVSPYYNYSMFCCGIPSYDICGHDDDWKLLFKKVIDLSVLLGIQMPLVTATLERLTHQHNRDSVEFWRSMFRLDRCGSGHQTEVGGWITSLYHQVPELKYVGNFSSHVGAVKYTNVSTNKRYEMYSGLFCSDLINNTLVPKYGWIVKEAQST